MNISYQIIHAGESLDLSRSDTGHGGIAAINHVGESLDPSPSDTGHRGIGSHQSCG